MAGIGNFPLVASCVAAISPSVAAGTMASARTTPTTGINEASVAAAMYMKKRPASASGCLKKV